MAMTCSKCGSSEILPDVPVFFAYAAAYNKPKAWIFKGQVAHRFLARVCGECGFAEFYVENPKGLAATIHQAAAADA